MERGVEATGGCPAAGNQAALRVRNKKDETPGLDAHRPVMLLAADPMVFIDGFDSALAHGRCTDNQAGQGARAADGPGLARCSATLTTALQEIIHRFNDLAERANFLCRPVYRSVCGIFRDSVKILLFQVVK